MDYLVLFYIAVVATLLLALLASWIFRRKLLATPYMVQVPPQYNLSPILLLSATALSRKLRAGELTSVEVVTTFISHIKRVNPFINALVFDRFELAMQEAIEADKVLQQLQRGDKGVRDPGWLLGVPCTVKECMEVAGCPNTSGHRGRKGIISTHDSVTVARIRQAGAIVLGVTNTSEMCMWMESHNYVYGITRNPYDVRCLVGGSSGGEGAAIGAMFAPFGIGSDIGGSIRMPCFFNGVFGHKASTRMVPNVGQCPTVEDSGNFLMTTGPICRHAEDLLPLLRTMAEGGYAADPSKYPWCPLPPPQLIEFRDQGSDNSNSNTNNTSAATSPVHTGRRSAKGTARSRTPSGSPRRGAVADAKGHDNDNNTNALSFCNRISSGVLHPHRRLRVYAIEDLGLLGIHVSPSQTHTLNECAQRLARELHADVTFINLRDRSRCSGVEGVPAGWENMRHTLNYWGALMTEKEPTFITVMSQCYHAPINPWRELLKWFCGTSEHTFPAIFLMIFELVNYAFTPASQQAAFRAEARALANNINEILGDDGVIICPTFPEPAPRHHAPCWYPLQFQYTALFNAMQTPATAVPIWEALATGTSAPDPLDARRRCVQTATAKDFHLPRGVQVVSRWGNDVLSLSVAAELERMFGGYKPPSWAHFANSEVEGEVNK